jgi:hypothetical protein
MRIRPFFLLVVLVIAALCTLYYLRIDLMGNPLPQLVANLPSNSSADATFNKRVKERFPIGSSSKTLTDELYKDGFVPGDFEHEWLVMTFTRTNGLVQEKWNVAWKEGPRDTIADIRASYGLIGP